MSENKIKFVLIGCGRIAKRHSELLGNNCISNASLSGVCDLNIDSAKKIAGKYSIPAFDDYHKMIKTVDPDVIVVLTESGNHAKNVLDIVKYKILLQSNRLFLFIFRILLKLSFKLYKVPILNMIMIRLGLLSAILQGYYKTKLSGDFKVT